MEVYPYSDGVIVKGVRDFDPVHIFECGQCFRWEREPDGSYTGVAHGRVINIKKEKDDILIRNTNLDDFENLWQTYFDMDRDYGKIKQQLEKDHVLKEAIQFGWGIRILNQDPWECLISFILSSNNIIPRIKKIIRLLCEKYGQPIMFNDKVYYSFPAPGDLYNLSPEDLAFCRSGYRCKYVIDAVRKVWEGEVDLERIRGLETSEARKQLMKIQGVGPKVADCILLFSMQKHDVFPTDVWVRRVIGHFFLGGNPSVKDVQEFSREKFNNLSGFAQQYLFYYAREKKIGR
ncbi:MAG: DNA-3-methyladenine glycosylase 2 family protein [Clostridiaceae bacterium]|nr:DNA-3-methyladenine glycosylase 2 family protein [Clostridiaceae bacterium]